MRNLADPQHRAATLLRGARRRRAHPRAGLRDQRAPVHRRWPTPSRRSRATRRRCRQFIAKQPADAGRGDRVAARPAAVPAPTWPRFSEDFSRRDRASCAARCPTSTRALEAGTRVQRRVPELNEELEGTFDALERPDLGAVDERRAARARPRRSRRSTRSCASSARTSRSATTRTTSGRTSPSTSPSRTAPASPSARCSTSTGRQDDSLGSIGADEPANGEEVIEGNTQYLHGQPYGAAVTPDGRADCEAGQRGYLERNAALRRQAASRSSRTPRTPGAQGPTYTGRARVPEGQTFTAIPETGPRTRRCLRPER